MTQGPGRFEYYLIQIEDILLKASRSENAALYLYQHDARTKLFMLEGLSKLYSGLHNSKMFEEIKKYFKTLEDLLGAVDYYDAFSKDFLADPEMPVTVRLYTEEKRDKKLAELNAVLLKKKWINHDPLRTKKIRKKLKKADWQKPEKELSLISKFYDRSIKDVESFYAKTGVGFTDIELQVHDLRRMLRWLSIYPQALQGAIQLNDNGISDESVSEYLIPEIVNSPFNKLPVPGNNTVTLLLEKKYFLALSYMISSLGKIKDEGLRVMAIAEAMEATQFLPPEKALTKAFELNKTGPGGIRIILEKAKKVCSPYFEGKYLPKIKAVIPQPEEDETAKPVIEEFIP
ncbi:MAG: hypothetical protein WKF88_07850 [Ferruginibacter sp.]